MARYLLVLPKLKEDPRFLGNPFFSFNEWDLTKETEINAPNFETAQTWARQLFEAQKAGNFAQLEALENNFKNETGLYRIPPAICEILRNEYPKVLQISEVIRLSLN